MTLRLPRAAAVPVVALGVLAAVVLALLPVNVQFGGDPLLRLRQLDPELSPPSTSARCGSPVRSLNVDAKGTSLYELARAGACERAARRRLLMGVAAGSILVLLGVLTLAAPALPLPAPRTPERVEPRDGAPVR